MLLLMRNQTNELTAQLSTFVTTDFRAGAETCTGLTAQLTTFMRTNIRAAAQTNTELTSQLTTFIRPDVRADAQATIALTAQLISRRPLHMYRPEYALRRTLRRNPVDGSVHTLK